ncbi:MAG TPA: DUF1697 domain-containing protein [Rhodanobacteraceae bacterium]|nr:DUF1697 domain-containing protein [Rhodanobacteraceae bacterium]
MPKKVLEGRPSYVAFLRGVSPMNLRMADLRQSLERAGFEDVRTVLSSGNAVFTTTARSDAAVARAVEAAIEKQLGRTFPTIVRRVDYLVELLGTDPYARFKVSGKAKRIVTLLPEPHAAALRLPIEKDGARILAVRDGEVFSAYLPTPRGPVFMALIEKTFGTGVTTRTWDTLRKCAAA